ncbi:phospholipase D2 isoform X1 [Maniola jurtina]|uniref:phospholipase D2 isoform X1 n=2 Tax=Maniola jurtina TaxID=191418 RepID=UPI001E68D701|nr:phospholipase D2 isoform X1 [Maniola jurtina]XP_045763316.1 phospholipase D2 isoform X1 [Maniola jurtina]
MYTSVKFILCNGQNITYQHPCGYRDVKTDFIEDKSNMERKDFTLSFHNLIKRDEELYGYTNYGMETPTPTTTPGDCFQSVLQNLDSLSSPCLDSDFDESLAVPESLSVIDAEKHKEETDASAPLATSVPYKAIHAPPVKFNSVHRKVFIPGVEIKVRFVENERSVTTHLLNPNLYTINLQHGDFTWTIKKRYKHILYLHQQLSLYRASLKIPFPTKTHKSRRASFKNTFESEEKAEKVALEAVPRSNSTKRREGRPRKRKGALPRFPKKPEVMVTYEGIQLRMKQLEEYLYNLLNISIYRNHHETVKFLEVSQLSFITELGTKGKEGMIQKRTGSTRPGQAGCNCFGLLGNMVCVRCNYFCTGLVCAKWQERWFFVKDTFFGYVRPSDGTIKGIMLFDQGFEVSSGMYSTGLSNGLQILNNSRQMVIKCWTKRKSKEWMLYLKTVANQSAREFTFPNVHHSFAPPRPATPVRTLVDGSAYLSAVADAMDLAREEIFIADWWLSPEIYLKRPALNGDYWRLDTLLKRKAAQGVKVCIMLYKEVEMALGINSFYSKSRLASDNIKVFRHPDHAKVGIFFWAHHEKIVVVDQTIAFVGGIDLCYGRWDDHRHRLTDLGNIAQPKNSIKSKKITSSSPGAGLYLPQSNGIEAALELAKSSRDVVIGLNISIEEDLQETQSTDEVQTEDIPKPESLVLDPGDHLLQQLGTPTDTKPDGLEQKKNVLDKIKDQGKEFISIIYPPYEEELNEQKFDDSERKKAEKYARSNDEVLLTDALGIRPRSITEPAPLAQVVEGRVITEVTKKALEDIEGNSKLWIGKDYVNFIVKDFNNLDLPFVDLVDRNTTPRMPWHDIGVAVQGAAARDVARHFIQRWNAIKLEKARQNTNYPYLLPKTYTDIKPLQDLEQLLNLDFINASCQVLRSVSCWSCGFLDPDTVEQSIHEAYVDTITRAQHYVYIENQFFITLSRTSLTVRNQIGEALFNRIMRAHRANETFRVYVVMPLLPGFEGEVGGPSGTSLHAVTHWNYQSISRSKEAIITRLYEAGVTDPSTYITFHGLRTHATLDGEPITELVYVHSKLLIADDRYVICGSANINDRSMIGKRDSEIAVLLQDEQFDDGVMNGKPFPCGRMAGGLRRRLFREHLGLMGDDVTKGLHDPCAENFYRHVWKATSTRNTEIYEEVFNTIPTDAVHTFAELKKYQEEHNQSLWHKDPALAHRKIDLIQGFLVDMPLDFLCNETLTPRNTSMEGMMPTSLWT